MKNLNKFEGKALKNQNAVKGGGQGEENDSITGTRPRVVQDRSWGF